ncbi:MAG TPA: sortase [Candidatus Paceibacterota bacterium]|nr:sortase [Candidatus Paceibacterota bacterium]
MHLHHRRRVIAIRLLVIFCSTFIGAFLLLNLRFVEQNVQYFVAPGTIRSRDTLGDAIRLLPQAGAVAPSPLPDAARLVIDEIGVDAPIVFNVANDEKSIYARLEDGVVHYSNSAKPGNPGAAVILGHSSAYPWYKGDFGAVFALLSKLDVGTRFYVQYEDNRTFVYEVSESVVFNPFKDDPRLTELENMQGDSVILISCYPVGTDYLRIAVRAVRVQL